MLSIKGKRQRSVPKLALDNVRPLKRGRPLKPKSELKVQRSLTNTQLRQYQQHIQQVTDISPRNKLSLFESLPNELIQYIFFLCLEINLPRTSTYLSQILSIESTYKALILLAYFDEEEDWPIEAKYFKPAPYRTLSSEDKIALQSGIVECRWFTLDRVQSCLPILSWLKMTQLWYKERACLTKDVVSSVQPRDDTLSPVQLPDIVEEAEVESYFQARLYQPEQQSSPTSQNTYLGVYLPYIKVSLAIDYNHERQRDEQGSKRISVLNSRVLPAWLVRGKPWTDDNIKLLQLLRRGSLYVGDSWSLNISTKAVLDGITSAVREQHVIALTTLLELRAAIHMQAERSSFDSSKLWVQQPLPVEVFHLATRQKPYSSALVWLLLRASIESVSHDDAILTRWALDACAEFSEHPIAQWLIRYMDGSHDYELQPSGHVFEYGAWSASTLMSNSQFDRLIDARRFDEELGYCQ